MGERASEAADECCVQDLEHLYAVLFGADDCFCVRQRPTPRKEVDARVSITLQNIYTSNDRP